jgi:hypothetical protein
MTSLILGFYSLVTSTSPVLLNRYYVQKSSFKCEETERILAAILPYRPKPLVHAKAGELLAPEASTLPILLLFGAGDYKFRVYRVNTWRHLMNQHTAQPGFLASTSHQS